MVVYRVIFGDKRRKYFQMRFSYLHHYVDSYTRQMSFSFLWKYWHLCLCFGSTHISTEANGHSLVSFKVVVSF